MGSLSTLRKACGALKDSTSVSLAKLKSDFKDLDIAIVKATKHVEAPPKERHIQTIFAATERTKPRADVAYCVLALSRRLARTSNWIVAIKVLIVIHRALREGDPTFREELTKYSFKSFMFHMYKFNDDTSPLAFSCSGWVCAYAAYLEERLKCIRTLEYHIEAESPTVYYADPTQVHRRTPLLSIEQLLQQLPSLQELLYRTVDCKPQGGARTVYLIQYSLSLVLKESFNIYGVINDGINNLVDTYFEMPKHDAAKALGICKRAAKEAKILADFYDSCKHTELRMFFQFPTLIRTTPSFLDTMEDYVKEAEETSSISYRQLDLLEWNGSGHVEQNHEETKEQLVLQKEVSGEKREDSKLLRKSEFRDLMSIEDLLALNDMVPKAEETGESNALALFNTSTGNDPQSYNSGFKDPDITAWELALFSEPSNDSNNANSMQNAGYGNGSLMLAPFQQKQDAFAMSNSIAPLTNLQIASLNQQNQQLLEQYQFQHQSQNMNWTYYHNSLQYLQPQMLGMNPSNPFEDPL